MSSSSSLVLALELRQSRLRLLPAGLLLTTGSILPWLVTLASVWRALLVLISICLAWIASRQAGAGRASRRLTGLSWQQNREWRLQFAAGAPSVCAVLSNDSWLSPWLMCLKFRDENKRSHRLMLWRAELSAEAWQQWRLRLRLEAGRPAAAAALD